MSPGKYLGRGFNHRKLLQADEVDEENLGYEDLKEVLTDDFEGYDDSEIRGERTKRNGVRNWVFVSAACLRLHKAYFYMALFFVCP